MVKKMDKISRSKFNICWISILVIFLGTIIYPISYERAERKALANENIRNIIETLTPLPTPVESVLKDPSSEMAPVVSDTPAPQVQIIELPEVEHQNLFNRDLKMGDRGADVKLLQQYLNQRGFLVSATGVGSPGNETELFGANTRDALKRFQEANASILLTPYGLTEGTGYFGSATRTLLNS
jgi:hypothetical protein